jgi:hypothetical protein
VKRISTGKLAFNNNVELLHFSHFHHVSLVHCTNRLLPTTGAVFRALGVQPTLWNWDYLLALSRYSGGPNVIPDHLSHWLAVLAILLVPVSFSLQATD